MEKGGETTWETCVRPKPARDTSTSWRREEIPTGAICAVHPR